MPQATEWQHVGNQIDAALIFARAGLRKHAFSLRYRLLDEQLGELFPNFFGAKNRP